MQGKVLRAQNSFFYVATREGLVEAKLRGRLKKERIAVVPGDDVELELTEGGAGVIERRCERKSLLRRPSVANIDQVVLVFAAREPDINPVLIDRFLVLAEWSKIERIILCINKMDLLDGDEAEIPALAALYREIGYPVCLLSTVTGEGVADMQSLVEEKTSVFAGSSGVGKSSLLNCLTPGIALSTGAVSEKIKRGRHTTRTAQLLPFAGFWRQKAVEVEIGFGNACDAQCPHDRTRADNGDDLEPCLAHAAGKFRTRIADGGRTCVGNLCDSEVV